LKELKEAQNLRTLKSGVVGSRGTPPYTSSLPLAKASLSERERLGRCGNTRALLADERTIMSNILVGNLNPNVTEHDIRPLFEKHGAVRRFKMMTDRWTGLSRGFGFIEMKADARAEEAIVALNGTNLNGKVLKVNQARPQLHRTVRGKSKE